MHNRRSSYLILIFILSLLLNGGLGTVLITQSNLGKQTHSSTKESKNLIVMIADGMGMAQVTAANYYSSKLTERGELALQKYYVGKSSTMSIPGEYTDESGAITDSAAAATALATGEKTHNNSISVSHHIVGKPLASVIEVGIRQGKATGIVTTDSLTGATPAAFATHVRNRGNQKAIASQLLESQVNVLFGGGKQYINAHNGRETVFTAEELSQLSAFEHKKVLGLFADNAIPYTMDRDKSQPSLAEMTSKAIDILEKDEDGFVLMVEGGRIDHAAHSNDFPAMIHEVLDFDEAFKAALDFAKKNKDTSIIVTADHETGGMTLGINDIYELNSSLWSEVNHSSEYVARALDSAVNKEEIAAIVAENTGLTDLNTEELSKILQGEDRNYNREGAYNLIVSNRLSIGWTGHGHTAVDVGVWAFGPIVQQLSGSKDNTDIAREAAKSLGLDLLKESELLSAKYLFPPTIISDGEILFPAEELGSALNISYRTDTLGGAIMQNEGQKVVISAESGEIVINGTVKGIGMRRDSKWFIPLEVFQALADKTLEWDSLSERIVLSKS